MDEQSNSPDVTGEVSLRKLIEAGMIAPGTRLFKNFAGDEREAILQEDGSLFVDGAQFASPSSAAQHVVARAAPGTAPNRNGWRWWQFRTNEGAVHELDDLRQQYLARHGGGSIGDQPEDTASSTGMSQERSSQLLKEAFNVLAEEGALPVGEVMRRVEARVPLNDYERSLNKSGRVRWANNLRWYSVDTVRAGWLEKNGVRGIWSITPAGREALSLPASEFWPQAHQAYLEWQKTQKQPSATSSSPVGESAPEDLDELRTVIEEREGQLWWVNQGATFELERNGGYLWAPRKTKGGFAVAHHLAVASLRPRDVVLHYANGALRAVSRVTDDPIEADRPSELPDEAWDTDGFLAHAEYHTFVSPIRLQFIPLKLRTAEAGPFTQDGAVKQGYLFQVSEPFVSGLVELLAPEGATPISSLRSTLKSLDVAPLVLSPAVLTGLSAALDAGNHVILLGPPGTGKTHLAELVAKAATQSHYAAGYLLTTASADWTTFDTIGGYMPNPKHAGELEFQPGVFLEALAADYWVVLDEINRADADKAFGALLTLLAGFDVRLTFQDTEGLRHQLVRSDSRRSHFDAAKASIMWAAIGELLPR